MLQVTVASMVEVMARVFPHALAREGVRLCVWAISVSLG